MLSVFVDKFIFRRVVPGGILLLIRNIFNTKAVKQEHPLVHLEIFDIQLGHQFDNLDCLKGELVVAAVGGIGTRRLYNLTILDQFVGD